MNAAVSQSIFYNDLSESQRDMIDDFSNKRNAMINDHMQKNITKHMQENSIRRKYNLFIRVYVRAIHPSNERHEGNEAILTLWDPSEDQMDLLHEGVVVQFRQLGVGSSLLDGMMQLSANKRTTMERIDKFSHQEALDLVCFSRRNIESMLTINIESKKLHPNSLHLPEVECLGYLLLLKQIRHSHMLRLSIFLMDASGLMLKIEVDESFSSDSHFRELKKIQQYMIEERLVAFTDLRLAPYDHVEGCAVAIWTQSSELMFGESKDNNKHPNRLVPSTEQADLLLHKLCMGMPTTLKTPRTMTIVFGYVADVLLLDNSVMLWVDCNESEDLMKIKVPKHSWQPFLTIALEVLPEPKVLLVQESKQLIKKRLIESSIYLRFMLKAPCNEVDPYVFVEATKLDALSMVNFLLSQKIVSK